MLATAPLATKNKVLFFGPFTGSKTYLRDGTNSPYVYNYRAGYYDEAEAIIDYLASARLPRIVADPAADHQRIDRIAIVRQRMRHEHEVGAPDLGGQAGVGGLLGP